VTGEVEVKRKVYTYITRGAELVVFRHTQHPEAGIQVPGGSLEPDEEPEVGALREAHEETGLEGLARAGFLGEFEFDLRPRGINQLHRRFFFHLRYEGETPERWLHYELTPSDGSPGPVEFELYWVRMPGEVPELMGGMGQALPELYRRIALS
jgi:8-oxo-dGTP pyrophosphatase MutT (NUDIX family)